MRVEPAQLVPGCVLIRDVLGKTSRPIIPKNTVLTEEHIELLKFFLIHTVDVSGKLASGDNFRVTENPSQESEEQQIKLNQAVQPFNLPFQEHYQYVLENYKKMFATWQGNLPIDMHLVRELVLPLLKRVDDISDIASLLHQYGTKRDYFYHHNIAVAILASHLAKQLGYPEKEWLQIGLAGFLSNAGMAKINPALLVKEGKLAPGEREQINNHPTLSYRLIEHIPTLTNKVKLAVLQHHERIDGSGYPLGLTGDKIHTYGRIIAVCDMYHAMTSERMYKEKQSPFIVIEKLQKEQFSSLDPKIVQAFIQSLATFPVGTKVCLSNNDIAEIVFNVTTHPTRPIVRLEKNGEIISLENEPQLFINEIISDDVISPVQ